MLLQLQVLSNRRYKFDFMLLPHIFGALGIRTIASYEIKHFENVKETQFEDKKANKIMSFEA